jgi:hypothetical protein
LKKRRIKLKPSRAKLKQTEPTRGASSKKNIAVKPNNASARYKVKPSSRQNRQDPEKAVGRKRKRKEQQRERTRLKTSSRKEQARLSATVDNRISVAGVVADPSKSGHQRPSW